MKTKNNVNVTSGESSLNQDEENEKTYAYGVQLIGLGTVPFVLNAIIEMGVLQMINDHSGPHGLTAAEVAAHIGARNPEAPSMLDRMLRLLATYSVVGCTAVDTVDGGVERRYRVVPVTKLFLADEDGVSLAPNLSLMVDKVFLESWSKLKEAVLDGGVPFKIAHGMDAFEYCANDPRLNKVFHQAMGQSTMLIKEILAKYKGFDTVRKLVDVGGSLGYTIRAITSQYPSVLGINFDLPHVLKSALPCPGVEHVGGDMFESVPNGDAIFMKWILHNWSDEHCIKLLKNCNKALPEDGKVIVFESIVPDEPESTVIGRAIGQIDVTMMTEHVGGKERTLKEFESLAKAAGFRSINLQCFVRAGWIFEICK